VPKVPSNQNFAPGVLPYSEAGLKILANKIDQSGGGLLRFSAVEKQYVVLDEKGEAAGSFNLIICPDYVALEKIFNFRGLVSWAKFEGMPSPADFGFGHFRKQIPIDKIYPMAVLSDFRILHGKRRQGIGRKAIRAFRVVAEQHAARLGLLRVGTQIDEIKSGIAWRQKFYESDGWVAFKSPPIDGLIVVWMYHLLARVSMRDKAALITTLVEKPRELIRGSPCARGPRER